MPYVQATSRSKSMRQSMHYIATGVIDVTKGRINKPKSTATKGVNYRNYLMEGIHCRGFILPGMSSKQMMGQYHLGLADMRYYLNQRPNVENQSDNIVISFKPGELDWRKPNDLMAGRWIAHHFVQDAFPNNAVYTGYQMDNANRISHIHLAVNMIDEKTGLSDDNHNYFGGWKLQRVEEHVTKAWNRLHPEKYIEPWKISMHHHTLMPTQKKIVDRTKPFIKHGTDFYDLHQEAPKHGVILNAFRKNGEKIIGKDLHDTDHVNGYAVHLIHHHRLQNKPIYMTGNMLSEYIPGVKTRQLKKTMQINTLHARQIQNATAKLERISNANQVMSNQTISNATSARSSASLNLFKSNLISSAARTNSKETSQVITSQVTRANHIISNMTHNNSMHQAHILHATSEKAQQRSQAVMTMQYSDINSSANQELQPNSSAEHTYQSHANQFHKFQNSLLTSYANRSLSSVLASGALYQYNHSLLSHQIKSNQSLSSSYNAINKINSIQSSNIDQQLSQHQEASDLSDLIIPDYYQDYKEQREQEHQGMVSSNSTQSSQRPIIFVPGMDTDITSNSTNDVISHSTNSGVSSDLSNHNIITQEAQSQVKQNSNSKKHNHKNHKKLTKRQIKNKKNNQLNSQASKHINTSLIIPDLVQEFRDSQANKNREEQSFASEANHQQGFQASLSNIRDAYIRDSIADTKSFDNRVLSSAVKENTSNNIKIAKSIKASQSSNGQQEIKNAFAVMDDAIGNNSNSSNNVTSNSSDSISNSSNQSNISNPTNQSKVSPNSNRISNSNMTSNNIISSNNTQSSSQTAQQRLQSMDNDYKKLFASSASNEKSSKDSYVNSVFNRADVTAYLNDNGSNVVNYGHRIKRYANLNNTDLDYIVSEKIMHNIHRDKKLQQQRHNQPQLQSQPTNQNSNIQFGNKKQTKEIRQAKRDHGIGGR